VGTNLNVAVEAANWSVATLLSQPRKVDQAGNNWMLFNSELIGDFHSYYQAQYFITSWGYLALTDDKAMYPSNGVVTDLEPGKAILIQFSGRPPLRSTGF